MATGLLIVMARGSGARRMAGPGSVMSLLAGRLITMGAGSYTTGAGFGVHAVITIGIAAGGGRRWLLFSRLISISVRTIAGTRCTITSEILVRCPNLRLTFRAQGPPGFAHKLLRTTRQQHVRPRSEMCGFPPKTQEKLFLKPRGEIVDSVS